MVALIFRFKEVKNNFKIICVRRVYKGFCQDFISVSVVNFDSIHFTYLFLNCICIISRERAFVKPFLSEMIISDDGIELGSIYLFPLFFKGMVIRAI